VRRVEFQLEVGKRGAVVPKHARAGAAPDGVVAGMARSSACLRRPKKVAIGATVPDFTLTDQSSRPVHLADFRGRVVALKLRLHAVPSADVCPRLCGRLRAVARSGFAGRISRCSQ